MFLFPIHEFLDDRKLASVLANLQKLVFDAHDRDFALDASALALREVLCRGGSWGCKLLGVRVNKKLLLRIAGGAITLLTLLAKFVDEGELDVESASGI